MLGEPIKDAAKRLVGLSNSGGRRPGLYDFPVPHEHYTVGERHRLSLIMCYVHGGDPKLSLEVP